MHANRIQLVFERPPALPRRRRLEDKDLIVSGASSKSHDTF